MHNKYSVVFILKRVGLSLSYKKGLTNIKQYCTYWGDGSLSLSHIWRSVCHSWHGSGSSATQSRRRSHHQHSGTCPIQDNGIWCYFPAKCCEHNSLIHENKKGPATHVWNMYKFILLILKPSLHEIKFTKVLNQWDSFTFVCVCTNPYLSKPNLESITKSTESRWKHLCWLNYCTLDLGRKVITWLPNPAPEIRSVYSIKLTQYTWTSKCRWSWWAHLPGAMLSTTQSKQNIKCTLMI